MSRLALLAIAAAVPLAACATAPAIICPPLVPYSKLQQDTLSAELPMDGPETVAQIEDYVKLRQACRAPT